MVPDPDAFSLTLSWLPLRCLFTSPLPPFQVVPDPEDEKRPRVEYLVQWKDGSPDTW